MTTGEQNAMEMIAKLNDKYNKKGIAFDYYVDNTIIFITFTTPSRHYRLGFDYSRFLFDESLAHIRIEIEEGLANNGLIQGDEKELIKAKAYIIMLEDNIKRLHASDIELREKIELQESVIQELKHIIETNGMNTRKRG